MASLLSSESRRLYSWWWDSHVPKNSKWLQENLTVMDAKVKAMIKLIEEDADSFARRAEMYYKKRPELMKLVEEFYRAYRALAERYDHITGELRQAHRTMSEAFPDDIPSLLAEDSPLRSPSLDTEQHTSELLHPFRAINPSDDSLDYAIGIPTVNLPYLQKSGPFPGDFDAGITERGLKQLNDMLGAGEKVVSTSSVAGAKWKKDKNLKIEQKVQTLRDEVLELSNRNQNLDAKVLSESQRAGMAESEVLKLKEALGNLQAEKETILTNYKGCLEKLVDMEKQLCSAQNISDELGEKAKNAETEVQTLKETLQKLEAERDAVLVKQKENRDKISSLEIIASQALEDVNQISEQATKAEYESESLKEEGLRLVSERDAALERYNQCLQKISHLENKLLAAEANARILMEQAHEAETEVKKLKIALSECQEEKEAFVIRYRECVVRISFLENELHRVQEEVQRLNNEILIGAAKLKNTEEKCTDLEISNQLLHQEADHLMKKIEMKDHQLTQKQEELEKLQGDLQIERLHYSQIESTLQALQNLHSQSQEEQRVMTVELKNALKMLRDLEVCKTGLEDELRHIKNENESLNEAKLSSTISMENLQAEILGLREIKERLEAEVTHQMGRSESLQQEISHLKKEIEGLDRSYEAILLQLKSVGVHPDSIDSSIKKLQDENSELRQICERDSNEKKALCKKLEDMEQLLNKTAIMESSLSGVSDELQVSREKVKTLQESCQILHGEKSILASEKAVLLSQLQIVTENMQKLLEKNAVLENSLSGAKIELEGLREKSKGLEEICLLLKNEKSNLLTERNILVLQLENVGKRLDYLEKRCTGLEDKYAGLEKEKQATEFQLEHLRTSLTMEKQERMSFAVKSESRIASLEGHMQLLQEESKWRKKDFEEEIDRAVKAQFEIFVLQKFIQDMEEKNYSLLVECQKHVEASKLAEKLISELENENLEQEVEAELLLNEIEKLRLGIYQVFKAVETVPDSVSEDKIENEQVFVQCILGTIADMKSSLREHEDDEQRVLIENSVLLAWLGQLKSEEMEVEMQRTFLEEELKIMAEKLILAQSDKHKLLEMNNQMKSEVSKGEQQVAVLEDQVENLALKQDILQSAFIEVQEEYSRLFEENRSLFKKCSAIQSEKSKLEQENNIILLEALDLINLSTVFKSSATEKTIELKSLCEEVHQLQGANNEFAKDVQMLRGMLEIKEAENFLLQESVKRLEMELKGVKESNDSLKLEVSHGKDVLKKQELKITEVEQKLGLAEKLNSELCQRLELLQAECQASMSDRQILEDEVLELSKSKLIQNEEIERLQQVNRSLVVEVGDLCEQIDGFRSREENLNSELQEKCNDFELWEAEAAAFYFDLQLSSVREVLFENKIHELAAMCESLETENSSKTCAIQQMKEDFASMEREIGDLKSELNAYSPVITSLKDDMTSLENSILLLTADNSPILQRKYAEDAGHPHQSSPDDNMKEKSPLQSGIQDLLKLQTRIKTADKLAVETTKKLASRESSARRSRQGAVTNEIEQMKPRHNLDRQRSRQRDIEELGDELFGNLMLKTRPKVLDVRNISLMKDIPLDHSSDVSLHRIRKGANGSADGTDEQMLELWETAENRSYVKIGMELQKQSSGAIKKNRSFKQSKNGEQRIVHPSSEFEMEKELGVDKLELSTCITDPNQEGYKKKILERLSSDAQKLESLQLTVDSLKAKLEVNKKGRKSKNVDFETVKEQLQEVEETVLQLVNMNGQLMQNIEDSPPYSKGKTSGELKEASNARSRRLIEQAKKGSEKIGRLQMEIQKIQYVLLKMEDEKKSKGRSRLFKSKTGIILRDFIYNGRKNSGKRKKAPMCACFRPSSSPNVSRRM